MKKIFVLLAFAPAMFPAASYAGWTKIVCNGGPNGYDIVNETHSGKDHQLICIGEGTAKPQWSTCISDVVLTTNGVINISKDIEPMIEKQIQRHIVKGEMKLDDKTTVSWRAIKGGYSLTVED